MSLNEVMKKLVKDFDKESLSEDKIKKILDSLEEGHRFIIKLIRDKNNFDRLKDGKIFDGHIDSNKKGYLRSHNSRNFE